MPTTTKRRASEAETACWRDLELLGGLLATDAAKRDGDGCRKAIEDIIVTLRSVADADVSESSHEVAQLLQGGTTF